jgi:hypothetical protein
MTVSFQEERLADVRDEALPLLRRHWDEIALDKDTIPLEPDWERYARLEELGVLKVITARLAGVLVGYASFFVLPNIHYKSLVVADGDIFWVAPDHRDGTGYRLLKAAEAMLVASGVRKIVNKTKLGHDAGPVFERLGYRAIERVYAKTVGAAVDRNAIAASSSRESRS